MADSENAETARRRRVPLVFKALALCFLAFVALLILLPAPPEIDAGGVTQVARHVPKLRDTVDPITGNSPPVVGTLTRSVRPAIAPSEPPAQQVPVAPPVPVNVPAPAPPVQQTVPAPPAASAPVPEPALITPATPAPAPAPAPDVVAPAGPAPPNPVRKPGSAGSPESAASAGQGEESQQLPWRIPGETAALPPDRPPAPEPSEGGSALPSASAIDGWVKSQAWEFLGGVDAQGNILYRFEVWLEAPDSELKNVKSVAYEYDAPSATPKSRETDRAEGGFRVRFGSLACAKEITVTLTMADGRKQRAKVDGCRVLN